MTIEEKLEAIGIRKGLPIGFEPIDTIIIPNKYYAQKLFGITLAGFTIWAEKQYKEPIDQILRKMNNSISFVESMIGSLITSKRVPEDMETGDLLKAINYILEIAKSY